MANKYYDQAAAEVDSYISSGKAVNAKAREQIVSEYALYLKQLEGSRGQAMTGMEGQQEVSRARMANRLAARNMGGDGAVQFNYGRLNAAHEGERGKLESDYMNNRANLLIKQGGAVGTIDGQDAALEAARLRETNNLGRSLEDRDRAYQYQQAQLAMARAAAGGGGGGSAADDEEEALFKENLRQLAMEGVDYQTLKSYAVQYERNLDAYLPMLQFNQAAKRRYRGLNAQPPSTGGYTSLRDGSYSPYTGVTAGLAPQRFTPTPDAERYAQDLTSIDGRVAAYRAAYDPNRRRFNLTDPNDRVAAYRNAYGY